MQEKIVSVIIPVYNCENYLNNCIDSIVNQTYKFLEIILVNDESTDNSPKICEYWKSIDSRIQVIHKSNEGASFARKTGLEASKGDYVMFIDSDDWIDLNTIEKCINKTTEYDYDCILFSYIKEYSNKSIPHYIFTENLHLKTEKDCAEIHKRLIGFNNKELDHPENIDNISSFCMKLYKRKIAKQGKFFSDKIIGTSEDTLFNVYALEKCKSICYINECLYHYQKSNNFSLTTSYKNDLPEKWDILYKYFQEYFDETNSFSYYEENFLNRVACASIGLGLNEINSNNTVFKIAKKLKNDFTKPLYKKAFQNININACPYKWKVYFTLCRYNFYLPLSILLKIINFLRSKI